MAKRNAVVVVQPGSIKFWNGKHWVNEYPDAKKMTLTEAYREVKANASFGGFLSHVVIDYGLDSEEWVAPSEVNAQVRRTTVVHACSVCGKPVTGNQVCGQHPNAMIHSLVQVRT